MPDGPCIQATPERSDAVDELFLIQLSDCKVESAYRKMSRPSVNYIYIVIYIFLTECSRNNSIKDSPQSTSLPCSLLAMHS